VSWWANRNWPDPFGIPFLEKLREEAAQYFNPLWFHLRETDHIIHFEDLERELSIFLGEPVELEHRSVGHNRKGRHWREFYDDETRAYVEDWLSHEITFHGYGPGGLYHEEWGAQGPPPIT
jgi:hypothetical protein